MKRTNIFTKERAEIRKRLNDVAEALRRVIERTEKFLGISRTSKKRQSKLDADNYTPIFSIPPRLLHLATNHKKARVRKKNLKRIHKIMYGGKK